MRLVVCAELLLADDQALHGSHRQLQRLRGRTSAGRGRSIAGHQLSQHRLTVLRQCPTGLVRGALPFQTLVQFRCREQWHCTQVANRHFAKLS